MKNMDFEDILQTAPFSMEKSEKENILTKRLIELTRLHSENCSEYKKMLDAISFEENKVSSWKDLPFLPVRLFKDLSLKSIRDDEIVKTMTSSGTTGQAVSKIFLDRTTSSNQQKTMVKIVSDFTGSGRMPMIIVDCPSVVKDRRMFSARGAGILGFSIFGAKKVYALDDDMKLDVDGLKQFLEENKGKKILLFGFTFMIWQYFYKELVRLKYEGIVFDLSEGIMIHGGGWKKLINEEVSPKEFHDSLQDICGLDHIHDYYGMVEQTGCIYMQCECGHLHASIFSDIVARRTKDFSICDYGEKGILQVVSTIPESYPGHSLLTEDEGIILGEDDCPCGRKGKYFEITGRIKNAEIRGCSDTFATDITRDFMGKGHIEISPLERIDYIVGNKNTLISMSEQPCLLSFDDRILDFLSDISKELMTGKKAKMFPDIVSLGFWLRKTSLISLKDRFEPTHNTLRIGRGVAFHIAPSNVPINFAYSLFSALLCGNSSIVRVPTKRFPQTDIIADAITVALNRHMELAPYICLVRYERDKEINDLLSDLCDVRIIWGGDKTISELRKSPIGARTSEITFADRYSLAVIDTDEYMSIEDKTRLASDFYNDTYLSDQNACTSPRVIVWTGDQKEEAKRIFWEQLYKLVDKRYDIQVIQAVDKLTAGYEALAVCNTNMEFVDNYDNRIVRIKTDRLLPELMDYRCHSGYFYEYDCNDIMEIKTFCDNTHCQTISVVGNKDIIKPLLETGIKGVDRVVSIGRTMDFDLFWDGYNLVERLTRNAVI